MSEPVHVLHVLEATEGGTRRWIEDVLLGLDPERVKASLICSNRRDATFATSMEGFRKAGIRVEEVSMERSIRPSSDFQSLRAIRRLVMGIRPTLIHAHSSKAGVLGRIANRLSGEARPMVYTPHGFSFLGNSRLSRFYRLIEKMCVPLTDRLLAVSESEKIAAKSIGYKEEKINVIENGVSIERQDQDRPEGSPFIFGTLSALRPQKDPITLLEAFKLLSQQEDVQLRICGVGPLEGKVRSWLNHSSVRDRVKLCGRVPDGRKEIEKWDLFVLPSIFEGLPYSVLEAMASGVPVVATRVPGNIDVIEDGVNGILVPPNDPEMLANAILRLVRNPGLRSSLSKAGRERIESCFRLDVQLERLTRFYESFKKTA